MANPTTPTPSKRAVKALLDRMNALWVMGPFTDNMGSEMEYMHGAAAALRFMAGENSHLTTRLEHLETRIRNLHAQARPRCGCAVCLSTPEVA